MQIVFYRMIIYLARLLGSWVFALFAWFVATGFFLLFPARVGNSMRFYRVLLPEKNHFYYLRCAWRQFHNFTDVYFDRFVLQEFDDIAYTAAALDQNNISRSNLITQPFEIRELRTGVIFFWFRVKPLRGHAPEPGLKAP